MKLPFSFFLSFSILFADLPKDRKNIQNNILLKSVSGVADNGPTITFFNINSWKIQMEHQGFFQWNGTSHSAAGNYPKNMGSVMFAEGILWGAKVTDNYSVDNNGQLLTNLGSSVLSADSSYGGNAGNPVIRVNGSMYNTGLKAGKVLRDANGRIKSSGYSENYRDQQIWRVRRDWMTADLTEDASILRQIFKAQVTEAMIAADKAQYEHDWKEWPAEEGAPYEDVNKDGSYTAATWNTTTQKWEGDIPGYPGSDQTVWTVANDLPDEFAGGSTVSVSEGGWGSPPIGFEIQITLWGYDAPQSSPLANVMFKEAKMIYVGLPGGPDNAKLDGLYFTQWADPDLGTYQDDYVGSDKELSLGFVYNGNRFDDQFKDGFNSAVPAAGHDFLEGPKVDLNGDGKLDTLGMTSFSYFASSGSVSDPSSGTYVGTLQWYNLMEGYLPRPEYPTQQPFIDPITGLAEKIVLSGDPIHGSGWVDGIVLPAGDRRYVMSSGPISMALNDTQKIVTALVGGMGTDNLTSLATLKFNDRHVQYMYDKNFILPSKRTAPNVSAFGGDKEVFLDWNNEFNRQNLENSNSTHLPFEGYKLWQLTDETGQSGWPLATFSKSEGNIYIDQVDPGTGLVNTRLLHQGDKALAHQYIVTQDHQGNSLENNRTYYFGLQAYSKSSSTVKTTSTIENSYASSGYLKIVSITPRNGVSGVDYKDNVWYTNTDTSGFTVTHTAGSSDGQVNVRITNPEKIRAGTYDVKFNLDTPNLYWDLVDKVTGDVLLDNYSISDQSDSLYEGNDFGFQVRVAGPPEAFNNFIVVANKGPHDDGSGNMTECTENSPCQGSQDWGGFPTTFTGRINQSDGKAWFFHAGGAADNTYDIMISRIIRGSGWQYLIPNDFEYRFTYADSNYAYAAYTTGSLVKVPFEVWDITNGVRLIPWFYDFDGNEEWGLHPTDHPGSGGSNDPYTDWTYPHLPADVSKGDTGYKAWLEASIAKGGGSPDANGRYDGSSATYYDGDKDGPEVMGRNIFYVWNLDDVSDGTIDAYAGEDVNGDGTPDNTGPEKGTVFRITTTKTIQEEDVFTFTVVDNPTFTVAKGDVNIDESIDVADVVSAVDHIIESTPLTKSSQQYAADYNSDFYINIADGVGIVNKILGISGKLLAEGRTLNKSVPATIAMDPNIQLVDDKINVRILTQKGTFSGIQFKLNYPLDIGIKPHSILTKSNGLIKEFYTKDGGTSHFILMSLNGQEFASSDDITISLYVNRLKLDQLENVTIELDEVLLSSSDGNMHSFTLKNTVAKYVAVPTEFALHNTYPNPFNPSTLIPYDIATESFVSIKIVDILGREVASLVNENKLPGKHHVRWFGKTNDYKQLPSGIYFVQLKAGPYSSLKKITLLK